MPIRRLPRTDEERASALNMGKTRKDNVPATVVVITPSTIARLDLAQPEFNQRLTSRGVALANQSAGTASINPERNRLRMFVSHFFQGFNNGVARGVFNASQRAYYQLDVSSDSVPPLDSDEKLNTWGERLLTGDTQRTAAGFTAMAMPTAADVQLVFDAFSSAANGQANLKTAYDNAQEAVAAMRGDVDSLILRMWNEVEAAFSEDDAPSKRRKARQWGVVYISSPGEGTEKEGPVASEAVLNIFQGLAEQSSITARNLGSVPLVFYRALADETPTDNIGHTLQPETELTLPFSEFGPEGDLLNVYNTSAIEGDYLARLEGE